MNIFKTLYLLLELIQVKVHKALIKNREELDRWMKDSK